MEHTPPVADFEASDRRLTKSMSLTQLLFLSLGAIIGSGWLFAVIKADAAAGPAVVVSWVVGGILMLLIALTYAELCGMLPRSGALVRYPHLSHGGYTGFIMGWAYLIAAIAVPTIEAEAVVTYLSTRFPALHLTGTVGGVVVLMWPAGIVFGIALMAVFTVANYAGIRFLAEFNRWVVWWKLVIPTATFILLFASFHGANFTRYGGFAPMGVPPVFQAIATSGIVFAYLGFRQALEYGGEARNPQRDVPLATILSVLIAMVLYALLQIAFTGALDFAKAGVPAGAWHQLLGSPWASGPLYDALNASGIALLGAFGSLLLIDAAVSPSGTGWIYLGAGTRTFYGMSVMRYLPAFFQRMNRFGIPWISLAFSAALGAVFLFPLPSWYSLVSLITSATALTYMMGGVGLPVLRRTAPELHRPYRLPAMPLLTVLSFVAALMIVYWSGWQTLVSVVTVVFAGLCLLAWVYAPRLGWIKPASGAVLGIAFLIVWVLVNRLGGWFLNTGSAPYPGALPFSIFFPLYAATVIGFTVVFWLLCDQAGRAHVSRSWWLVFLLLATLLVSYVGEYGPLKHALLTFPLSDLLEVALGVGAYVWGVASGFQTDEIRAICGLPVAAEPTEPSPGPRPGPGVHLT